MGTITDDTDSATVSITKISDGAEPNTGGSTNGKFRVTLSGQNATATTVSYAVSGSATQGADDATLAGSVTIPAFATTADIDVNVIDDSATEGADAVTLTLGTITGDPQITVNGAANTATLSIGDDESTTVSVSTLDPTASETGTNNGQFRVLMDNGKLCAGRRHYRVVLRCRICHERRPLRHATGHRHDSWRIGFWP